MTKKEIENTIIKYIRWFNNLEEIKNNGIEILEGSVKIYLKSKGDKE